jgi:hypothetical protein
MYTKYFLCHFFLCKNASPNSLSDFKYPRIFANKLEYMAGFRTKIPPLLGAGLQWYNKTVFL